MKGAKEALVKRELMQYTGPRSLTMMVTIPHIPRQIYLFGNCKWKSEASAWVFNIFKFKFWFFFLSGRYKYLALKPSDIHMKKRYFLDTLKAVTWDRLFKLSIASGWIAVPFLSAADSHMCFCIRQKHWVGRQFNLKLSEHYSGSSGSPSFKSTVINFAWVYLYI